MKPLLFEHTVIDDAPAGTHNDVCLIGDIDGDGRNDVVVGDKYGTDNVVWYENPGWERHVIATAHLEAGGVLVDITGDGRLDIVAGNPEDFEEGQTNTELYWFESPETPRRRWTKRVITSSFRKYHNQALGDVDGDGQIEIVFASQGVRVVGYFDIPDDPTVAPWPESCCHLIAQELEVEGLWVADLDGDGENEVVAGPNVFKRTPDGWERTELPGGLDPRTCVAVGDLAGDGRPDIVLSEGECDEGRLVWLRAPDWRATELAGDLFHPHSLALADFDGNGSLDIFVGEMGLGGYPGPRGDGDHKYSWDYRNRLIEVQEKQSGNWNTVAEYRYDGKNRRILKVVTNKGDLNGTTRFLWGGKSDWQCLEERDGSGDLVARYTYTTGYIDAVAVQERDLNGDDDFADDDEVVYYHSNTLYSIYALSDADENVIERMRYDSYGAATVLDADFSGDADGTSDVENPYTFTARRLDLESDLMQYRNRYYDPALGRFISRDPAGYSDRLLLYGYAGDNPSLRTDPLGLRAECKGPEDVGTKLKCQVVGYKITGWQNGPKSVDRAMTAARGVDNLVGMLEAIPNSPLGGKTIPVDAAHVVAWWNEILKEGHDYQIYAIVAWGKCVCKAHWIFWKKYEWDIGWDDYAWYRSEAYGVDGNNGFPDVEAAYTHLKTHKVRIKNRALGEDPDSPCPHEFR